jgi:tetratricopeptide (TPR) repeat protein
LERYVAEQLDPEYRYFDQYRRYLARLPDYPHPHFGREAVVSHLGRIKRVFVDCYTQFVQGTGKTVVIGFDTVEAVRGTYLLVTLTQWMKALPSTLFILSGRPMLYQDDDHDPIRSELAGPHKPLPVELINLREFAYQDSFRYLNSSDIAHGLSEEEKRKLVHLTRGHPLWLATAISYLAQRDMPEEASLPAADIERIIPYEGPLEHEGKSLQEEFKRRLVAPYREGDFWHEAIKRLAVLRQAINVQVWQQLMADTPLPRHVPSMDEAWRELMHQPWIRPRSNGRYVTLHDAMAEELAHRIIPLHDQDQQWQRQLWQRAMDIYKEAIEDLRPRLDQEQTTLDQRLDATVRVGSDDRASALGEIALIQAVARFDAQRRELDQFTAARLFYQLLSDFELGCRMFLDLFEDAAHRTDFYAQELFALEMYRFLPDGTQRYALGDVVGKAIDEFRRWLPSEMPGLYREIGISIAAYLNWAEQQQMAFTLLNNLPMTDASTVETYRANILLGNACMRIAGHVKEGEPYFHAALEEARSLDSGDRHTLIAEAQKELGFYFRNEGNWKRADTAYRDARDAILEVLSTRGSDEDREEMASIYTNWAYVKGLTGEYRDGTNLAEGAIAVRHQLGKYYDEGISWSVCGEVNRYERQFRKAWEKYSVAEQIFHGARSWTWLGVIYQEQAICLFQAMREGINLVADRDPLETAKRLIKLSLDICRDQAVRNYPSALNRAGRIFGSEDPDIGLAYLSDGIGAARRLSDGWFWLANLIEYVELCYRTWVSTKRSGYIDRLAGREHDITRAMNEYEFPDLRGRWYLVQGHLDVHSWLDAAEKDERRLRADSPGVCRIFRCVCSSGRVRYIR